MYRYRLNKTSHEKSLGTFPEVKLSEAKEKLVEQKRLRLKSYNYVDPILNLGPRSMDHEQS